MSNLKLPVQALVLFASLRNHVAFGGHYSTKMVSKEDALKGRKEVGCVTKNSYL